MKAKLNLPLDALRKQIRAKIEQGHKAPARVLNQVGLNVAGRMFDLLPPNVHAKRMEVKNYLSEPVATRVRLLRSGKRKGKFGKSGAKRNQLIRVNLIINALRGRIGAKGLYGKAMRKASASFRRAAANSQGFLKSTLLPIIRALNPLCKFKVPFSKTSGVSRWPGSAGYGMADPAKPGPKMFVRLTAGGVLRPLRAGGVPHLAGQDSKVQAMMERAMNGALQAEAKSIEGHLQAEMLKDK